MGGGGKSRNAVTAEEKLSASVTAEIRDVTLDAQQAARYAVLEMGLFPELPVALKSATGYGPHVDMLQHLCYWFHPRHPRMQKRWTLYKTYKEWRDECSLSRKQVDKGRKSLRELGLATEKKGPHGRIQYRVDWVAVAEVLGLSLMGKQTDAADGEFLDLVWEDSLSPVGGHGQFVPQGEQSSLSPIGEQPNTGDYARGYLQENSSLQEGAEPAFAEPAPPPIDKVDENELDDLEAPDDDKRHPQVGETRHETTAATDRGIPAPPTPPKLTPVEVSEMLSTILKPHTSAGRMALAHVERGGHSPELIADALCVQLQKPEGYADLYLERLPEALEWLRLEMAAVAP